MGIRKRKPDPVSYNIQRIADILDIPEDRIDAFLADFRRFYDSSRAVLGIALVLSPKGTKYSDIAKDSHMTWIDDGKKDGKITINVREGKK